MAYVPPFLRNGSNQLTTTQLDGEFTAFDGRIAPLETGATTWHGVITVVAPGNISLAAPGASIDGVALANPSRVLLSAQTTTTEQGVYDWTGAAVALVRSVDSNTGTKLWNGRYPVSSGTSAGAVMYNTNATLPVLGTDTPTFVNATTAERSAVATLTNKRINKRVTTIASSATPTPAGDSSDIFTISALAVAAAVAAPTGTPVNGQTLVIRIKDNGTARALTWNAIYVAGGFALPSTTVISKLTTLGFYYDTDNALNKWCLVGYAQEA